MGHFIRKQREREPNKQWTVGKRLRTMANSFITSLEAHCRTDPDHSVIRGCVALVITHVFPSTPRKGGRPVNGSS